MGSDCQRQVIWLNTRLFWRGCGVVCGDNPFSVAAQGNAGATVAVMLDRIIFISSACSLLTSCPMRQQRRSTGDAGRQRAGRSDKRGGHEPSIGSYGVVRASSSHQTARCVLVCAGGVLVGADRRPWARLNWRLCARRREIRSKRECCDVCCRHCFKV